jgi:hypothetical protein
MPKLFVSRFIKVAILLSFSFLILSSFPGVAKAELPGKETAAAANTKEKEYKDYIIKRYGKPD